MCVESCYVRKIGYEMACIIYQNSGGKEPLESRKSLAVKVPTSFEE